MNNLLEYLENTAARLPGKTAYADGNEAVTFAGLVDIGKRVGAAIYNAVGAGRPVPVVTTHSVADVAAFVGALYAGCFYVPLDGFAPESHVSRRAASLGAGFVIRAKTLDELPTARPDENVLAGIRQSVLPCDPAYAIFTSGSTGAAKAALIPHGAVINLTEWLSGLFGFSEKTVFAGQAPFYFDSSVQELYCAMRSGASLHLIPRKLFISPLKLMRRVDELGANVLPWAAAAVKMVAFSGVFDKYAPGGVTDVIFGGENMPGKVLNIWRAAMPGARFANVYGPTETTVDASCYIVERPIADGESVPIGTPCNGARFLLIDENGGLAAPGQPGEIYIRGAGVGLGYYADPERTRAAFVQNPLHGDYIDTVYKTGDIARENQYGELVYLSRADGQVKHMGSRVELGEVEAAAAALDGVGTLFCAYDGDRGKILLFYEGGAEASGVSVSLGKLLPRYMCPSAVIKIPEMPRLPNGKIDRIRARGEYYDGRA